jgi:Protein of unknown function (DUF1549)/Protein of unknown function (DUF1553)/Planctomycete cytochrome C
MRLGLLAALAAQLYGQPAGTELFEKKIRPVLAANCYGCHSSKMKTPMGGLALDTKAGTAKVIVPGNPAASTLLQAITYKDLRLKMPPTGPLPENVVADFKEWIAAGAPDPRNDAPGAVSAARVIDYEQGRKWWSFQPVHELPLPAVKDRKWPQSRIDSFILARLEANKLKPSPEADPRTLIRRVYLDLTGLKPTYEEVEAYATDPAPDRYAKLVDRLLASSHYGERWARYWMDVMRYAEDNGSGGNYLYAWRYRDWLIEALNKDVPYDRFVKLQLAADQMADTKREDLRALGFLGVSPVEHKELKLAKDVIETLMLDEWDERIDVVTRGMLGLSVACARCHDHKFDPITSKDYYGLAGVFASTSAAARPLAIVDPGTEKRFLWARQRYGDLSFGIRTLSEQKYIGQEHSTEKIAEYKAELEKVKAELREIARKEPSLAATIDRLIAPPPPKTGDAAGGGGNRIRQEDVNAPFMNAIYDAGLWLDGSHPDITMMVFKPDQPRDLPVYARGNGAAPGPEIVPRRFLTVLAKNPSEPFQHGSGRIDLADKIVTDAAPLAARVIVNRVWGWHFDRHLVATPSDFGDRGEKPTHPEMLDDLAARFIANGWSLKWLHREILLSAAYRQSSHPRADAEEIDPANNLIWRMNPRRMDIEAYRDSMLETAGMLKPDVGGPSVDIEASGASRRTVYAKISRSRSSDLLRNYDFPIPMQHSPTRVMTVTPLQQLFVMNSPFVEQVAAQLAKSVDSEPDNSAKVKALYRKALTRNPTGAELDAALTYLNSAPLARFAQVLLASNEEIFWQ